VRFGGGNVGDLQTAGDRAFGCRLRRAAARQFRAPGSPLTGTGVEKMAEPVKVIVTGAAQGIGRAVALRMAAAGTCVAVWDTQTEGAEQTARMCRETGVQSRAWRVDVGVADEVESAVAAFEREWGRPDGLVNNAGIFPRARALDMELWEWE